MSLGQLLVGLFGIAVGVNSIAKGAKHLGDAMQTSGNGVRQIPGRVPTVVVPRSATKRMPRLVSPAVPTRTRAGVMGISKYQVNTLGDRLAVIIDRVEQGTTDPQIIAWARKAVSKRRPGSNAWNGSQWENAEKDHLAESVSIFKELRNSQRYVSDPVGTDTFARARNTLATGAGDCLPGDTRLVTPRGLVSIKDIKIGDTIHDGKSWVKVTQWWDKGESEVLSFELNNRSFLRCTAGHKVFRVTRNDGEHTEERAETLMETDLLLQPREFACGHEALAPGHATILGAYIAEGWWDEAKGIFCISGIPNSKGLRERVIEAAASLGITNIYMHDRYLGFRKEHSWLVSGCGKGAAQKQLPHLNFDRATVDLIVDALETGDGGIQGARDGNKGSMTYSTASATLAHQYRVLKRMQGHSTLMRCLSAEEHGGAGSLPVWRLIVRGPTTRKPWARIEHVGSAGVHHVYDIETESHRIYLPDSDTIVHNCDEFTTVGAAASRAIGIPARIKVIASKQSPDGSADHVYYEILANNKWVPMDASVNMGPGWEAPDSMVSRRWIYEIDEK